MTRPIVPKPEAAAHFGITEGNSFARVNPAEDSPCWGTGTHTPLGSVNTSLERGHPPDKSSACRTTIIARMLKTPKRVGDRELTDRT
jgi:hypothetical protein